MKTKIIDLNENDLKRIVKKVLYERQMLNEEPLTGLAVAGLITQAVMWGAGAYISANLISGWASGKRKGLDAIARDCGTDAMGKPTLSKEKIVSISNELVEAAPSGSGLGGYFTNSSEKGIGEALGKIPTIPDYCAVRSEYEKATGEKLEDNIEAAFSMDEWWSGSEAWNKYVYQPLRPAKEKSEKATEEIVNKVKKEVEKKEEEKDEDSEVKKDEDSEVKINGGGNEGVKDLQKLLEDNNFEVGSKGIDGKFGPDTRGAVFDALEKCDKIKTKGASMDTTEDLQTILEDNGFSVGSKGVDGKFGPDTLAATLKALEKCYK